MTTKAQQLVQDVTFQPGDWFVFGSEGSGLPQEVRALFDPAHMVRLPMRPKNRSLNLSNSAAITVYEAAPVRIRRRNLKQRIRKSRPQIRKAAY